jgi:TetR/AcrR family transcriptional repressor of nem operon
MDTVTNAIEKLKIHVDNAVMCPSFPGGCPLLNAIIDNDDGNPALKKMARGALKEWRSFLEGIVKEGQDRKEIRPEIEPDDIVALVISLLEGAIALDRLDKKSGFLERSGRYNISYLGSVALPPA